MIGPTFEIETVESAPHPHLVVHGEVDIKSAPELEKALSNFEDGAVMVDLSDVTFIDSTGLRVLVMTRTRLESNGGTFILRASDQSAVVRTIRLAGLSSDFHFASDTDTSQE